MKQIKTYILLLSAVMLASCSQEVLDSFAKQDGDKMSVSVNMIVPTWSDVDTETRAGVASADIGIAAGSMQLLCFDKNGYYLGMGEDVTTTPTTTLKGGIKATVPASTSRVHFIANANLTEQDSWIGMYENTLISSLTATAGDAMVYWGYVKKDTPSAMKAFLEAGTNTVYMLRDVAKVSVVNNASNVSSVSLVVSNDADRGTLAPFDDTNLSAPFEYTQDEGAVNPFIPVGAGRRTASSVGSDTEQFIFESKNNASQQVFAILKIVYTTGTTRYHKIQITDKNEKYYDIKRNHNYEIAVSDHSETKGYATFTEAFNGTPTNDYYITLTNKVPSVTVDDYTLTIDGETSIIYNETGSKTIAFTTSGDADIAASDLYVSWVDSPNDGLTETGEVQLSYTNTNGTGAGTITFPIYTVDDNLRKGTLVLTDTKHRIRRHLNIYSTTPFEFNGVLTQPTAAETTTYSLHLGTSTKVGRTLYDRYSSSIPFYFLKDGEVVKDLTTNDIEVTLDPGGTTDYYCKEVSKIDISSSLGRCNVYFTTPTSPKKNSTNHYDTKVTIRVKDLIEISCYVCNSYSTSSSSSYGTTKIHSSYNPTVEDVTYTETSGGAATTLKVTVPDNYPDDLMPVTIRIASNDYNPTDPTMDVVVDDTEAITGQSWNFWYEYTAETKGDHTFTLSRSRDNSSGNELWITSDYFEPQKITFSY